MAAVACRIAEDPLSKAGLAFSKRAPGFWKDRLLRASGLPGTILIGTLLWGSTTVVIGGIGKEPEGYGPEAPDHVTHQTEFPRLDSEGAEKSGCI